jgi:hypothetical protein
MNIEDKFMTHVSKDASGCWLWTGHRMKNGYGRFFHEYQGYLAHRYSWFLFVKQPSQLICHTCDIRHCVNPSHLFEGDYLANNRDRAKKGRSAMGLKNGVHTHPEKRAYGERNGAHKLTSDQVDHIWVMLSKNVPQRTIAKIYGISQRLVCKIGLGEVWKDRTRAKELNSGPL